MRSQTLSQAVVLLAVISCVIGWSLVRSQRSPSKQTTVSAHGVRQVRARKPVAPRTRPLDWDQPVEIRAFHNRPRFPLSVGAGKEYLLIVNNLQREPGTSESIRLSLLTEAPRQTPVGCYFQNSPLLPQPDAEDPGRAEAALASPGSGLSTAPDQNRELPEQERSFYLFVTDGDLSDKQQYTRVTGKLIQHSPRVAIYLDEQQQETELAAGLSAEIIRLLEDQVLDQLAQKCGVLADIDQDGRFTILLSPWLGKLQGGKTSINGFVRPSDFREKVAAPYSNHCDMLYLNSALKPGQELFDLLSHEVTHAVVSSIRTRQEHSYGRLLMDEEDWLNEGIAHIMEPGFTNRDYRISEFYRCPEAYPLIVPDYYRARLWRNHGCRGAVNLFLSWCQQLDRSQNFAFRFTHHPLTGVNKIEDLTELPFSELFRQWSLYLARQSLQRRFSAPGLTSSGQEIHCGRFLLGGPAIRTWNLSAEKEYTLQIASTASAFIYLKSDHELTDKNTIKVRGFSGMQLTLVPLPQSPPRISLDAKPVVSTSRDPSGDKFIEIQVQCQHPEQSEVELISLELSGPSLSRTERNPRLFETATLPDCLSNPPENHVELAHSGTQGECEGNSSEFQLRFPAAQLARVPQNEGLLLKAVIRTQTDRQMVVQTELKLPFQPGRRLAGAGTAPRQ